MDETQEKHEHAVGDRFVEWYNAEKGVKFAYDRRPDRAPDLIYRSNDGELALEIGDAYYDAKEARMNWMAARKQSNGPTQWSGQNFDEKLIGSINQVIGGKCAKDYGANCFLIINVSPPLTTSNELEAKLADIVVPAGNKFKEIYLVGHFPSSNTSGGGFRCWKLA